MARCICQKQGVTLPKQSDGESSVMLELWENVEYPFIAITPRFTESVRVLSMGQTEELDI